jgi:mRNA interferase RelE/StbE
MKTIVLTSAAAKDLDALPIEARNAIVRALSAYAIDGTGDIKALNGRPGYRMRIGQYRVIFNEDRTTILAVYIGRRATTTYGRI